MEKNIDSEPFLLNKNDYIKETDAKRKFCCSNFFKKSSFGLALFLNFCLSNEIFSQDDAYKPWWCNEVSNIMTLFEKAYPPVQYLYLHYGPKL